MSGDIGTTDIKTGPNGYRTVVYIEYEPVMGPEG